MRRRVWTNAQMAELERLWPLDVPLTEIGLRLGHSANAVAGKAFHMGLPRRAPNRRGTTADERRGDLHDGSGRANPIARPRWTQPRTCQWPIGDVGEPDFRLCGSEDVVKGKPYCADHCARAYQRRRGGDDGGSS